MRALKFAAAAFVIIAISCAATWSVEASVQSFSALVSGNDVVGSESKSWLYTLTNTSVNADYTAWLLQIEVDTNAEALNASSPAGWIAMIDEQTPNVVMWSCWDQNLESGFSLDGFGVDFSAKPSYQGWTVMFGNISDAGDNPVDYGDVDYQHIVESTPEPGMITVMLTGLTSLAALAYRRRRK